jgi:predicted metal-dependent hydrolase
MRQNFAINYSLIRSNRKTLAIYIRDGGVEVRAPKRVTLRQIEDLLNSKEVWINSKLAESDQRAKQRESFNLDYGDEVLYRGKQHTLGTDFRIPVGLDLDDIKQACVQTYRQGAHDYITKRTSDIAQQMQLAPSAVKISNAKRQWGSCNSKGVLRFSWRLIMADDEVIDYVIVHELAHLLQMNHSPCFWQIVGHELPDYRERQRRLRQLQEKLAVQNWDV